jgi:hypothetical protein
VDGHISSHHSGGVIFPRLDAATREFSGDLVTLDDEAAA